jgi:cysteinyl-tRNA synthetase
MHNAFVRINKEKMSKSLGNFFTLKDVFKEVDPMVLRYYILTHHYRAPLDFSFDDVAAVKKSYQRLCRFFGELVCKEVSHAAVLASPIVTAMLDYVADDLNTPGMLGVLFDRLNDLRTDHTQACAVKTFLQQVIGLSLVPLAEEVVDITPEIQTLINEREAARVAKDWKKSDELRDQLKALGVELKDKKQ